MNSEQVKAWFENAVKDGWKATPTYKNEPIEQASNLDKDGWHALLINRPTDHSIHVWAPQGYAVHLMAEEYNMEDLIIESETCERCRKHSSEVGPMEVVAFANRMCHECHQSPETRQKFYYRGWNA